MAKLHGVINLITHRNEENGYTVARLDCGGEQHKIVGYFPALSLGETLTVEGEFKIHPEHGMQFMVEKYRAEIPVTELGLKHFLASAAFKGIGKKHAEALVEHFGTDIIRVIKEEPKRLAEVSGIGKKKIEALISGLAAADNYETMIYLQGLGLTPGYAARVMRHYGDETVNKIKENPYLLADEVHGIGFRTADSLALASGLERDDPHRIFAGIRYLLERSLEEGHCYLPEAELHERVTKALDVEGEIVSKQLKRLIDSGVLIREERDYIGRIFLKEYYLAEKEVAGRLLEMANWQSLCLLDINQEFLNFEKKAGISLADKQKAAVNMAVRQGLSVITGGPGTGKTTIVRCLIDFYGRMGKSVALAAPTGRAAQKLGEASRLPAKTIHRLLEYGFVGGGMNFTRNESNPLPADVIIVDEFSMVDIDLMVYLLRAVAPGSQLVLVGDMDQLPSVGPGNVLRDIITSGKIPTVRLDRIFRQSEDSLIVYNAHRVNQGEFPYLNNASKDFFFMDEEDPETIAQKIIDLCRRRLPAFGDFHPIEDIQVLSPMRRSVTGVDNLNQLLQKGLNPPRQDSVFISFDRGRQHWYEGDKVMQTKNDYKKNVYNGDIGRIASIDRKKQELIVAFDDRKQKRYVSYEFDELGSLDLAYTVSVHKSQGSEYPVVIMPITTQHFMMLQRNLIYTAITRAKKLLVLVGTKKALAIAVRNNTVTARYTTLAERLQEGDKK